MLLLLACADEPPADAPPGGEIKVTWSQRMPNVARVRWTSVEAGTGYVVYTPEGGVALETEHEAVASREHTIVVAGMVPGVEWAIEARVEGNGAVEASPVALVAPGAVADATHSVGGVEGGMQTAPFVLQGLMGENTGAVIFDAAGREVWSSPSLTGALMVRPRLSADRTTVVMANFDEKARTAPGDELVRETLEGEVLSPILLPDGHHDFALVGDGYAYLATDVRVDDRGRSLVGDRIVELDAEGNAQRTVWSTWDTWIPAEDIPFSNHYDEGLDWTHCNTLEYLPERDQYVVSAHNLSAVVFVDRASGEVVEQIGGRGATYTLGSGTAFEEQHAPQLVGDVLSVFDNTAEDVSSVRSYQLDSATHTYAELGATPNPAGANVMFLGDVARSADGTTLAVWGASGLMTESDGAGVVSYTVSMELGTALGFFEPLTSLGGPAPLD